MKVMMIDGSPKVSKSNSEYFLSILSNFIESKDIVKYRLSKKLDYEKIISNIKNIDILVIAFPLYVDSLPSHVLDFLSIFCEFSKSSQKPSLAISFSNSSIFVFLFSMSK